MRDAAKTHLSAKDLFFCALDGVNEIQDELTCLPLARTEDLLEVANDFNETTGTGALKREICKVLSHTPSMHILNHGHFVNYGGSYYSYLFAKMYAAQIWGQHFEKDPLNP